MRFVDITIRVVKKIFFELNNKFGVENKVK